MEIINENYFRVGWSFKKWVVFEKVDNVIVSNR